MKIIENNKIKLNNENKRYFTILLIIIFIFILFSIISKGFFSFTTLMNIGRQASALALASIGMTMVMLIGGIDLSVGAVIAFAGAVAAIVMQDIDSALMSGIVGIFTTISICILFQFINGFAIGYLKIAPFIVTLSTMSLARGLTLTITNSSRIIVDNDLYNALSQITLFNLIPLSIILVIIAYIISNFILSKTIFGRKTYIMGDNPFMSKAVGINNISHTILVYLISGLFIGLSTIMIVGRVKSAQPMAGINMEFDVITAVVVGGTSLLGGQGNLKGTILGVALISIISTGLGMVDIHPFLNYIIKGFLILIAVLSNDFNLKTLKSKIKKIKQNNNNYDDVLNLIKNNKHKQLTLKNISKSFSGAKALDNVNLTIKRGKVHVLCGENGAGKSTLMKILSGIYSKDEGEIFIDDIPIDIKSPRIAEKLGISIIYQELLNIKELSVSQNVNLGKEKTFCFNCFLNLKKMENITRNYLKYFDLKIDPNSKIGDLSIGQQQLIEIIKALTSNSWIIIMDEPTSAITETDKDKLFKIISELKKKDIAIVYISHRMSEIFEIADEISIIRDGKHIISGNIEDFTEKSIISYMVGREIVSIFDRNKRFATKPCLKVENLEKKGVFRNINFEVNEGEILGFSGLMGAGRTEIMRCLFGLDKLDSGNIYLFGKKININSVKDAINYGIVMLSEDRRKEGIAQDMSIIENLTISSIKKVSELGIIKDNLENDITNHFVKLLNIKVGYNQNKIMNLSGGNQQKVCIARCLNCKPKVIILDEPTRGVDIGAKQEIHKIIDDLSKTGAAIILISSELQEIIGAADRIITLADGNITKEFNLVNNKVSQEDIILGALKEK